MIAEDLIFDFGKSKPQSRKGFVFLGTIFTSLWIQGDIDMHILKVDV